MLFSRVIYIALLFNLYACSSSPEFKDYETNQTLSLDTIDHKRLILNKNKGLVLFEDLPFTGISVQSVEGTIVQAISFDQGKKNGEFKKWFESGNLSYQCIYVDGKKHGVAKSWWKNGNLRSESNFIAGIAHGTQRQWYQSGAKLKVLELNQGKEEGLQTSWRENGKIYSNYEAKNGRIFGLKRANLCYQLEDEFIK